MATIVAIATIATFPHRFGVRSQQTDAKSRRCKSKLTTNNTANDADWRRSRRDENVTGAIGVIGRVALLPPVGRPLFDKNIQKAQKRGLFFLSKDMLKRNL